ncbi:DNA helicase RecQ [Clostridium chauvoei]|uniref:DNA helicase RecQ n=2 Tax=Clostridium chauvoei TaxID=46867 RepID=S6FBW5_9CLOT|nr:DNA helicase RecQ [Clostridium chauvoei]ATD55827.1 ATP-dependent DNA helicase RecQ [Clostridium chauvoei]ATD56499.1 ATP-dependent DNA helicase RecQ [Clostridium chauvoei]MBX7280185.1 DNA helicase RecQ [Clostridium chauvoei]MBX7282705.1 DNA helicase RecQ [Clostridium chauvoei]MBX7285076.1 DNA helicase RecQ [Clostridium chauvoei]
MSTPIEILKKYFGYTSFREGQFEIISNILRRRDIFCIMPTGGGKSLCYQIPTMIQDGLTIVISPLISLMKDQVDNVNDIGIEAEYINSTQSMEEIKNILRRCYSGKVKLLYIAPERLENEFFNRMLRKLNISQIAIDEAHCVSMWGHDFRKSYRSIAPFINSLNKRPIVTAFTATATEEVRKDVIKLLQLENYYMHLGSFDRENLAISIYKEEDKAEFVKDFIKEREEQSGIIYCATRKEVDALYYYLKERNINIAKYHGGLKDQEKEYYQEEFLKDNIPIMIATNAFGMGIDKSNVRYIIHFTLCKNIENYYQEIGRGGRDGEKTECILLYNRADIRTLEYLIYTTAGNDRKEIEIRKLQKMIDFCETHDCYRMFILNYFGEINGVNYCSNCRNCLNNDDLRDFTIEAQMILSCVYRTREQYGISVLIDILRGFKGPKIIQYKLDKLTTYGIMKEYNSRFIRNLIKTLIDLGYVNLKEGTYSMLKLNNKSIRVLKSKEKVICKLIDESEEKVIDKELFNKLRLWRKERSIKENIKPYIIFSDSTLIDLANNKPKNKEELLNIRGMGEKKFEKYGEEVLNLISGILT